MDGGLIYAYLFVSLGWMLCNVHKVISAFTRPVQLPPSALKRIGDPAKIHWVFRVFWRVCALLGYVVASLMWPIGVWRRVRRGLITSGKAGQGEVLYDFRFGGKTNVLLVRPSGEPDLVEAWVVDYDRWRDEGWTVESAQVNHAGPLLHVIRTREMILEMLEQWDEHEERPDGQDES